MGPQVNRRGENDAGVVRIKPMVDCWGTYLGGLLVWKYTYEFSWFHFWYGVPFVGTLGRLNDITPDSVDNSNTELSR